MSETLTIDDPVYVEQAHDAAWQRLGLSMIRDPRDLPFLPLMVSMFALFPAAIYLYIPGNFRWYLGVAYLLLVFGVFFDRYILMLHNTSHRPLFKPEYSWLNQVIPRVLGPMVGQTPDTYAVHHIGMHHPENNLPDDLSCTMHYQRDSVAGFAHYLLSFVFLGAPTLMMYHWRRGRKRLVRRVLLGEGLWMAAVISLAFFNFYATLVVFIIPVCAARFGMMAGNWGQHAFIDAADPNNPYRNSITCINTRYNKRCFNDGYHISHHAAARRHWTDHPAEFLENRDKYIENDSVCFEGIDFFEVWLLFMRKRYDTLAKHFVDRRDQRRSDDEIIALLKQRTARIARSA